MANIVDNINDNGGSNRTFMELKLISLFIVKMEYRRF